MLFQKTLEKMRKNEGGFTLIELLVVMIIIGILAAIAIPVFLSQKGKAAETAIKNDVRNAATFAETYAVDNGGLYEGLTLDEIEDLGFQASDDVVIEVAVEATNDAFSISGTHPGADQGWTFDSDGIPQLAVTPTAPVVPPAGG